MKVAVPLFGQDVSPRLGSIGRLLVATTDDGRVRDSQVLEVENLTAHNLPKWLVSMRIGTLICGGISHPDREALEHRGIDVIWGVIGPAEAALSGLAAGSLHSDQFVSSIRQAPQRREDSPARLQAPNGVRWNRPPGLRQRPGRTNR